MDVFVKINEYIINPLIVAMFAVGVVYFMWGLLKFIQNQDNEEAQAEGKRHMLWAVIGFFLMIAVNGILGVIESTAHSFSQ